MADAFAFPFPYLGHGVLARDAVGKVGGAYLAFAEPVPEDQRAAVMKGCPAPINGMWLWGPTLASCESDGDTFDTTLAEKYAGGDVGAIDAGVLARFAADVEAWARGVHALHPLVFFIGSVRVEAPSAWGKESERVAASVMVPFLEAYVAENVADLVMKGDDDDIDDDEVDEPGLFDAFAMSCLLPSFPKTADRELNKRLDRLRARFGLGPKGTMVILPT